MRLEEVFYTSKHSSDKWQPYFEIYERHLNRFKVKEDSFNLVEVGVQKGGSLEMWSNYFGNKANITGIDIDPECANLKYEQDNIKVVIGDQSSGEFWDEFLKGHNNIHVFIDDGGHYMDQQITTFEKVFPTMPVGSIYICEDTHTSYMAGNGGGLERPSTFIEYAKGYVDVLHYNWKEQMTTKLEHKNDIGKDLTSVHFYDSVVVFEKLGKREMTRVFPK